MVGPSKKLVLSRIQAAAVNIENVECLINNVISYIAKIYIGYDHVNMAKLALCFQSNQLISDKTFIMKTESLSKDPVLVGRNAHCRGKNMF